MEVDAAVIQRLLDYKRRSTLRNAAINIMVKHLDPVHIQDLKKQFEAIDLDGSGFINIHELRVAIANTGSEATKKELQAIIDNVDHARNDKINYSEFIAATLDIKKILEEDEQVLFAIFNSFDVDRSGFITPENLRIAFSKYSRDITEDEIGAIMAKHDESGEGSINFREFRQLLQGK